MVCLFVSNFKLFLCSEENKLSGESFNATSERQALDPKLTSFLSSSEELSVQYVTDILLFHLQAFFSLLVEQCDVW
jgi:hypothetical protein